jgi:hypothetical protein
MRRREKSTAEKITCERWAETEEGAHTVVTSSRVVREKTRRGAWPKRVGLAKTADIEAAMKRPEAMNR